MYELLIERRLKFVENICRIFEEKGVEVYFVELEADINERINRNKSPYRLKENP